MRFLLVLIEKQVYGIGMTTNIKNKKLNFTFNLLSVLALIARNILVVGNVIVLVKKIKGF